MSTLRSAMIVLVLFAAAGLAAELTPIPPPSASELTPIPAPSVAESPSAEPPAEPPAEASAPSAEPSEPASPEPDAGPNLEDPAGITETPSVAPAPVTTKPARPRLAPGFAPRGAIRDHTGRALVADGATWDVAVRYEVIEALAEPEETERFAEYLDRLAQAVGGSRAAAGPDRARVVAGLEKKIALAWKELSQVTGLPAAELERRAKKIAAQVQAMKASVARQKGKAVVIAEQRSFRQLARIVGERQGAVATASLADFPWIRLTKTNARASEERPALVHLLGQVGRANARRAAADRWAADPVRAVQVGEACGISGAERLGDHVLRPWVDAAGGVHPGEDVKLTIDADLSRDVYNILGRAVKKSPAPCGGAAVVIDVPTGEIRALVGYPAPAGGVSPTEFARLAEDTRWTPLRFRAASSVFPPGSTIKAVTLYASLAESAVTSKTVVTCGGHYRKDIPNAFRCWVFNKTGTTHGDENAEEALRDSCNIFFFTAGEKLGAAPLIRHFTDFGLGVTQGTGLIEEAPGLNPTPEWMKEHRKKDPKYYKSDSWAYAFGQGELGVTPLQMANLAATLARGRFQPVTLMKDAKGERIGVDRTSGPPLDPAHLTTVRRGMWRVVNEKGGTADVAKLGIADAVLVGKTGSAQGSPRVLTRNYTFQSADGTKQAIEAPTLERARKDLEDKSAKLVAQPIASRFPEIEEDAPLPSHAWFIGWTQGPKVAKGASPLVPGQPCYAIAVLVEYGGAGGQVASPIARDIAKRIFAGPPEEPGPDVDAEPKKGAESPKKKKGAEKEPKKKPPAPSPSPAAEEEEEESAEEE